MAMEQGAPEAPATEGVARFELAPPRRFLLPAILLLLSERPGYGYGLVPRLRDLRFGRVDRPAVYRALAQLEQDGLVAVSSDHSHSGQARRVYSPTALGERALRGWMGVVREEHADLGEVIRRYQATGTVDALLSEVEGAWVPELDVAWSSVSTTSMWRRRLMPIESDADGPAHLHASPAAAEADEDAGPVMERLILDPARSAVLIDARSTVGPISFGAVGVTGTIYAAMADGAVRTDVAPAGSITVDVTGLTSGNKLYDAELQRRIDSRRFPTATVELQSCAQGGAGSRYHLSGELTFHGISRPAEGTVSIEAVADGRILITGEQDFDIRDFAVPSPTMLMLRIFPDVRVRLHVEAERACT